MTGVSAAAVEVAEISASAFRITGITPLLGRTPIIVNQSCVRHVLAGRHPIGRGIRCTLAGLVVVAATEGGVTARGVGLVTAYAALMLGIGLLACSVPTRCALRIEPMEALRADG
jgi:hypothetical protein